MIEELIENSSLLFIEMNEYFNESLKELLDKDFVLFNFTQKERLKEFKDPDGKVQYTTEVEDYAIFVKREILFGLYEPIFDKIEEIVKKVLKDKKRRDKRTSKK